MINVAASCVGWGVRQWQIGAAVLSTLQIRAVAAQAAGRGVAVTGTAARAARWATGLVAPRILGSTHASHPPCSPLARCCYCYPHNVLDTASNWVPRTQTLIFAPVTSVWCGCCSDARPCWLLHSYTDYDYRSYCICQCYPQSNCCLPSWCLRCVVGWESFSRSLSPPHYRHSILVSKMALMWVSLLPITTHCTVTSVCST